MGPDPPATPPRSPRRSHLVPLAPDCLGPGPPSHPPSRPPSRPPSPRSDAAAAAGGLTVTGHETLVRDLANAVLPQILAELRELKLLVCARQGPVPELPDDDCNEEEPPPSEAEEEEVCAALGALAQRRVERAEQVEHSHHGEHDDAASCAAAECVAAADDASWLEGEAGAALASAGEQQPCASAAAPCAEPVMLQVPEVVVVVPEEAAASPCHAATGSQAAAMVAGEVTTARERPEGARQPPAGKAAAEGGRSEEAAIELAVVASNSDKSYRLLPCDEAESESSSSEEDSDGSILCPKAAKRLTVEIEALKGEKEQALLELQTVDGHWQSRRRPFVDDVARIDAKIGEKQEELGHAQSPRVVEPPPPGPACLKFVDSDAAGVTCNSVLMLNLLCMLLSSKFESTREVVHVLNQVFLAWYVMELALKAGYYRSTLLCGRLSVVWWNWLDLGVVVSGILDQWVVPMLMTLLGGSSGLHLSFLRSLRTLRLFRLLRFLRILKAFLRSDLAWTEGAHFEVFMASVIGFNSVLMTLELDLPWGGWIYLEHLLLVIYSFELAVRLKRQGLQFFIHRGSLVWNYLDFVMVVGGVLDLWLMPLIDTVEAMMMEGHQKSAFAHKNGLLHILRLMRILRVLRLVRLLKMVKPLYRLIFGVMESMRAMQWVLVLTFLALYACSIVFTSVVGKSLLQEGPRPSEVLEGASEASKKEAEAQAAAQEAAQAYFGTVAKSLFSLFKLMNGDTSVVAPITSHAAGKLLFIVFMVVCNWAILAILTSVVSDHMMTTSAKSLEEDAVTERTRQHEVRRKRLMMLFGEIDREGTGAICQTEWRRLLADRSLSHELCEATCLGEEELNFYFDCLAKDERQFEEERMERSKADAGRKRKLDYTVFVEALKDEGGQANGRSILQMQSQLRTLEARMLKQMDESHRLEERNMAELESSLAMEREVLRRISSAAQMRVRHRLSSAT